MLPDWMMVSTRVHIEDPFFDLEIAKPTDALLDHFERAGHFQLPQSYRSFLRTFGPGRLNYDCDVRSPGYDYLKGQEGLNDLYERISLERFNALLRTEGEFRPEVISQFQDQEQILRMIYFGETSVGDYIGWD